MNKLFTILEIGRAVDACEKINQLTASEFAEHIVQCVLDSARGIYIGQAIGEQFGKWIPELNAEDLQILSDVDHDEYCDIWNKAIDSEIVVEDSTKYRFHTGECGDVFIYRPDEIELWELLTGNDFWQDYMEVN